MSILDHKAYPQAKTFMDKEYKSTPSMYRSPGSTNVCSWSLLYTADNRPSSYSDYFSKGSHAYSQSSQECHGSFGDLLTKWYKDYDYNKDMKYEYVMSSLWYLPEGWKDAKLQRWLDFIFSETDSPLRSFFKDRELALYYSNPDHPTIPTYFSIKLDMGMNMQFLMSFMIATRFIFEKPEYIHAWCDLVDRGVDKYLAMYLCAFFKDIRIKDDVLSCEFLGACPTHHMFNLENTIDVHVKSLRDSKPFLLPSCIPNNGVGYYPVNAIWYESTLQMQKSWDYYRVSWSVNKSEFLSLCKSVFGSSGKGITKFKERVPKFKQLGDLVMNLVAVNKDKLERMHLSIERLKAYVCK